VAVSAQRRRRGLIAIVAAVIAAGAFFFAFTFRESTSTSTTPPPEPPAQTVPVVVALTDIKPGDLLSSANLSVKQRPVTTVPATAAGGTPVYFQDTTALLASPHYAAIALASGTVLQVSMVASSATTAKPVVTQVVDLKAGDVAMSVPYDSARGAGGYIQPEDHIDIVVDDNGSPTSSQAVHYAFQDVRVIHVGSPADQTSTSGGGASLLLIEIPREKAAALAYLIDHQATIRYYLRPRAAYGAGSQSGSGAINANNWSQFIDG
jgi:pilus assembly protein CpaB